MITPRPLQAAAALLIPVVLSGCSSSSTPSGGATTGARSPAASSPAVTSPAATASSPVPSSSGALQVTIRNFAFEPAALTVSPGQTVTVVNQDSVPHTLTASDKSFDTGTIAAGATGTFTVPQSGTHPYICTIHPFMHGTLTVG
ncbi:cupredoxin family copper-binding protein [Kitasatospora sp. NPDC001539]|uniref:cupredoxin domain-containing protein n=1 Tax=unclassified Kitasatospora TaxID=2633591 RepID=UPI0033166B61